MNNLSPRFPEGGRLRLLARALGPLALVLMGLVPGAGAAAAPFEAGCSGVPFVNTLRPRDMEESAERTVGPQIFDIARLSSGVMLLANNAGLLEYDGASWRLTPIGRSATVLSIGVDPAGRVFAGGPGTLGEIVADPEGRWRYLPLDAQVAASERRFGDIWQVAHGGDGSIYFRADDRIFALAAGRLHSFSPTGRFTALAGVRGGALAYDTRRGLVRFAAGTATPVSPHAPRVDFGVTALAEGPGGVWLATRSQGLFVLAPGASEPRALKTNRDPELKSAELTQVVSTDQGLIGVGGLRGGVRFFDARGRFVLALDRTSGLPDDTVLSLRAIDGRLWVGTNGGASSVLAARPVENFAAGQGLPGFVEALALSEGTLYAATSQGVFRRTCGTRPFEPVSGLQAQSFGLANVGKTLLAATKDGVFEVRGGSSVLVKAGAARAIAPSRRQGRAWASIQGGVVALSAGAATWGAGSGRERSLELDARLDVDLESAATLSSGTGPDAVGTAPEALSLAEDESGRLWVGFADGRVLSGVPEESADRLRLTAVRSYGEKEGLASGFARVFSLNGGRDLFVTSATRVLRARGADLVQDAGFAQALGPGIGAFQIDAAHDGFWVGSGKRPVRLTRAGDGLSPSPSSLLRLPSGSRVLDFLETGPDEVWMGTDDGAFRLDPARDRREPGVAPRAMIRRVVSGRRELARNGEGAVESELSHPASLRIEVGSSSLDDPERDAFRFRLEGLEDEWSEWTRERRKEYTNLGPGDHTLLVETRDVYGRTGEPARLTFSVATPWYRRTWALALAPIALAGLFGAILRARTRVLSRKNEALQKMVDEKTRELREASFTDPLTTLRNRRYFAEVIEAEVSLAQRPGSNALHLFLVDIDHFKHINDTFGHTAGDLVLKQTAQRLKAAMRLSDIVFRWGGEEFLIVARGAPDLPRADIANRIVKAIGNEPFDLGPTGPLRKTCSVGFATFPFYPDRPGLVPFDHVLELTDLSLYRAKQTGRNRAIGVSPRPDAQATDVWREQVLDSLERAAVAIEVLEGPAELEPGESKG